jgi:osmotically-inducible protein OsmY
MRGVLCGRARRRLAVVLALLISVTALAACGKTVGETIDDATITTRVKTALLNDTQISALQIDVDTFKGIVTLSGQVASAEARQRAVAIARQTNGVVEVKSALQVNAGP